MLTNTIALALIAVSTLYLLWCASWMIGRPRVQVVVLRRSLRRVLGYQGCESPPSTTRHPARSQCVECDCNDRCMHCREAWGTHDYVTSQCADGRATVFRLAEEPGDHSAP
jgi:hypothetical protein